MSDHEHATGQWHAQEAEAVLRALETTPEGLSTQEARRRRERWGANLLPQPARQSALKRLLRQFHNVLIYVLLGAAAVTAGLGHWLDTTVILGVVVINAVIGFIQEGKAERALDAIQGMLSLSALTRRDGERRSVPAEDLVPGDVVHLHSGDKVPADLRLFQAKNLGIDEAVLTGESMAVEKSTGPVAEDAVLGDRTCLAFSGTFVVHGQGQGVVVATGSETEIGRISRMLSEVQQLTTPLLRQIAAFGRVLTAAILGLGLLTFLIGYLVGPYAFAELFLAVVALAVAAIPQGLPAIITITLAVGVQRMAARNSIIRSLPAVDTLGSVTVICSDKTGTLTRNEMMVRSAAIATGDFEVSGSGYAPDGEILDDGEPVALEQEPVLLEMARTGLLCNDARLHQEQGEWMLDGDPTEGALITFAMKAGLDPSECERCYPRRDSIPFESEHRFMATLHHDHEGGAFIYAKGAPERILQMCHAQRTGEGETALDAARWQATGERLAREGQRLIAFAVRSVPGDTQDLRFDDVQDGMVLLGIAGLMDPPRAEAVEAVRQCGRAGIRVKMITGDHALTAASIARQLGIGDGETVLTGHELDAMDDAELGRRAPGTDVFARTSPEHKLRLVRALQRNDAVVAMTGDGVNDAPALKQADIGVAMGVKGTEVSKQASRMVLTDDNFASITAAVQEGRTVYDNIKKAIIFILPTNGAEAGTILVAIALGMMLPITPLQILWINMVTAVTLGLALAFEPMQKDVMERTPRPPDQPLLTGFGVWRIGFVSVLLVATTFGFFTYLRMSGASIELAQTTAVNALVAGETFYLFSSRFVLQSSLSWHAVIGNRHALVAVGVIILLQMLFSHTAPFQLLFDTEGPSLASWGALIAAGFVIFLLVEAEKAIWRRSLP